MSLQTTLPAWTATGITPEMKLVWIMLADAGGDSAAWSPDLDKLAIQCCMPRKDLVAVLLDLANAGHIDIMVRAK